MCFRAESVAPQLNKTNQNSGDCVAKVFESEQMTTFFFFFPWGVSILLFIRLCCLAYGLFFSWYFGYVFQFCAVICGWGPWHSIWWLSYFPAGVKERIQENTA